MESNKKKLVILFNGGHLAYSPTVISLYDFLSLHFEVTIVAHHPGYFNNQRLNRRNVIYYKGLTQRETIVHRFRFRALDFFNKTVRLFRKQGGSAVEYFHIFQPIKKAIGTIRPQHIIAVDAKNLFYCHLLKQKAEFLSLEIRPEDAYSAAKNFDPINSVIIQSEERQRYLFGDRAFRTFYISNAPVFKKREQPVEKKGLVYCGTAWDAFGFYHCLEFLKSCPGEQITIKGAIPGPDFKKIQGDYSSLLKEKRLRIEDAYVDDAEVVSFLRSFRIGFCFYNFTIPSVNTFNYHTAPSGKLFKYLAAGVPVVCIDCSGLQLVRENKCGVLISDLSPESIRAAIGEIEADYETYSANCLKVAEEHSFDKAIQPFIRYLLNQHTEPVKAGS